MDNEIFSKITQLKEVLTKKIITIEDYNSNKDMILGVIEDLENKLKEVLNSRKDNNSSEKEKIISENGKEAEVPRVVEGVGEGNGDATKKKEGGDGDAPKEKINEVENNKENQKINEEKNEKEDEKKEIKDENNITNDNQIKQNVNISEIKLKTNTQMDEDEENEKFSFPRLNFDYDKNINEILNDINAEKGKQTQTFLKTFTDNDRSSDYDFIRNKNSNINNDIVNNVPNKNEEQKKRVDPPLQYLVKNKNEPYITKEINGDEDNNIKNMKMANLHQNGYSDLFSFNQELSNINNKSSFNNEEYIPNNNKIDLNNKDEAINLYDNIMEMNINNSEENKNINNQNDNPFIQVRVNDNINNPKKSKALRVADIIMKMNSNDILFEIITQLYSKDILNQLMSPSVDENFINIIEQTIEKITVLENEEIDKLRNKDSSKPGGDNNNKMIFNNNNSSNHCDMNLNLVRKSDTHKFNHYNDNDYNRYNKFIEPKKKFESNIKNRTSSSFYDKNNSSCYSQLPPRVPLRKQINRNKAEYLNSEILKNYPKTGKTILGYEKFKRDRNREFNFERSLRNDKYMDNYRENKNYNYFNISRGDSFAKNQSCYSNNRSFSNKRIIFNNYTSPFGDYFDSSLQKGGQSKLKMDYNRFNNHNHFKNCRSPVKDYINGINDMFI